MGAEISVYLILHKHFMELINKYKQGIFGQKLSHRLSDLREILDETTTKFHVTKETPHTFDRSRRGQLINDLKLSVVHLDVPIRYNMTQTFPFLNHKVKFFHIYEVP